MLHRLNFDQGPNPRAVREYGQFAGQCTINQAEFSLAINFITMAEEHLLDMRDLTAPAPLQLALAALDSLPEGDYLRLRVSREPVLLYPLLLVQGFTHTTRSITQEDYEVLIWHANDTQAEQAARLAGG